MADYSAGNLFLNIDAVATNTLKNLDAVIGRLNLINSGLGKITKTSGKKIGTLLKTNGSRGGSSFDLFGSSSKFFKIANWTAVLYSARRLGGYMAQIVQYGADYTETLNLWQTAMGGNLNIATEFVNKMNEAYGISEKTLMNAQAIFKNMLGSLGEISDTTAYALSEGITQMALDYASLYNVTFEQAFTKFQAALAGQVRPIRSVSGYDITENTLFQLYQELGGTKTMRQLSRTEKQLLAIYAIFNQMSRSGAVGDLDKTMESYANQSRVMAEAWQRVLTYSGLILTHLIQESQLMTYLNAILIFVGDTLMAVAESMGAVKSFGDIFESTTEGALDANEAIDEVQGKLLGFDKFRSLSGNNEENALGLDEKVLDKLAQFQSILGGASMEAKELAEEFKVSSGLFDEEGALSKESLDTIVAILNIIGKLINVTSPLLSKILKILDPIIDFAIDLVGILLQLVVDILSALEPSIEPFSEILNDILHLVKNVINILLPIINMAVDIVEYILPSILSIVHAITWLLSTVLSGALDTIVWLLTPILLIFESILKVVETISEVIRSLFQWDWNSLGSNLADIWTIWQSNKWANNPINHIPEYANGGLPDKGTMFVAGEAGAEMVYNMPSGQRGVANIQQIAQATYSGTMRALNDWWGGSQAKGDIPQLKEANATGMYQAVTGVAKSQGKVWATV